MVGNKFFVSFVLGYLVLDYSTLEYFVCGVKTYPKALCFIINEKRSNVC